MGHAPPLDPRIRLLQLPGVGLVAQFVRQEATNNETVEYEPAHVDKDGGMVGGSYNPQSTASMSYSTESGKIARD